MSNTVELINRETQHALAIHDYVGTLKLGRVMGPAYMKIAAYMHENDSEPQEAPFTCYRIDNWDEALRMEGFKAFLALFTKKWDVTMGFPTPEKMQGDGSIQPIEIPAGPYFKTTHVGPYPKVGDAYKRLSAYAEEHNLALGARCYEYYLNDPRETPKDQLQTLIFVPVGP